MVAAPVGGVDAYVDRVKAAAMNGNGDREVFSVAWDGHKFLN